MTKHLVLSILLVSLGACATIFDGGTQRIEVQAVDVVSNKPLSGARCIVSDEMGVTYMVSDNPGTVKVKKGHGILSVDCKRPGFVQKNREVPEAFNNTAFLNIFTAGAGFFVDAVSGAVMEYPKKIVIRMEEEAGY